MKKVAIILAEGFEEIEALATADILIRAGIKTDLISIDKQEVIGVHGITVKSDKIINYEIKEYDMIILPGGLPGATNLAENDLLIEIIKEFNKNENKYIAAICASPATVLSKAGIEKDRYITSYPAKEFEDLLKEANYVDELVVVDGNLITSRGPATTFLFAYKLVDILNKDNKTSEELKEGMLWNMLEEEKE